MKIKIEKLVHGGRGVGEVDGKAIFVPFAAPGDLLEVEITEDHGSWAEARIESIVETSSGRVEPKCPVFKSCGGCQWQHLPYEVQLEWKSKILKETFERIGKIKNPNVLPTMASPKEWHYRNKIQLHVDSKGRIGFYKPKSKEVVEFKECFIADERINEELNERREEYSKRDRGVAIRVKDGPAFVQINTEQNQNIREKMVEWISKIDHATVLELYAGAGNFTFEIAKVADRVVASDVDGRAIEIAKKKAMKIGAGNIEFVRAPSAKAARRMQGECDVVVLDPPRKGAADAIADIIKLRPKSILYLSCDPATLSRDILELTKNGYSLIKSLPIDMFPQTYHVESISLLKI